MKIKFETIIKIIEIVYEVLKFIQTKFGGNNDNDNDK